MRSFRLCCPKTRGTISSIHCPCMPSFCKTGDLFFGTTRTGFTYATVTWHWPVLAHLCACQTPSPNNLCLFCVIPGILLPLWVFCKSFGFFSHVVLAATFFLYTVSLLAPSLPWKWVSCIHQLVLIPRCPVPSFPPCAVVIAQRWCLADHIKWYIISHPSFPQVLFLISLHDLCALGCKHLEEECFMFNSVKPCANCWWGV